MKRVMAGRIPMVGDPKPLEHEKLAGDIKESTLRMEFDSKRLLAEAHATGDRRQIVEAQKQLKRIEKLVNDYALR